MSPQIDHIIVKLPHSTLHSLPAWLTTNFTISPGGLHADRQTENKLILFRDGTYIELIAFLPDFPAPATPHWWAAHDFGVVDWALTSSSADDVQPINERLRNMQDGILEASYAAPRDGGRTRPDGVEVKWRVTFPESVRRGEVPFWCHDVTPRSNRVPLSYAATEHPCGAIGVREIVLRVPGTKKEGFEKVCGVLFGEKGERGWEIGAPVELEGMGRPVVSLEEGEDGEKGFAYVSEIGLLTDTVGLGQSRTALAETLGEKDVFISFTHGRQD